MSSILTSVAPAGETTAIDARPARQQIGALTGLRFFAAIYVFTFHFGASFADRVGAPGPLVTFLKNGYLGVSAFFVLSGFILTYTYRRGVDSLTGFALARVARIYPVYLFALLIALPLTQLGLVDAIKVLVMVQSWTPFSSESGYAWVAPAWTLSVELAFYLCFPALILLVQRLPRYTLFAVLLIVAAVIVAAGTSSIAPGSARPDLPYWLQLIPLPLLRLPEFSFGMLICSVFLRKEHERVRLSQAAWSAFLAVILGLIILVLGAAKDQFQMLGLVTVLFGILVYLLSITNGVISRILASKPMQVLGGASYAIYLLQDPIRQWVRIMIPSSNIGQFLNPAILIMFSVAVFYWIEKPAREVVLSLRPKVTR